MSLREMLSDYWYAFQQELFPRLESELGPDGRSATSCSSRFWNWCGSRLFCPTSAAQVGRPEEDRAALARAFIAKAVFDIPTDARPDRAS